MKIPFSKYQGTGNDFVMIDNRSDFFPKKDTKLIHFLCDRRFGIGADGLILIESDNTADFRMVYYNADGNESTMCGNGGRCIVAFARDLEMIKDQTTFSAIDGAHHATIDQDQVALQMIDVLELDNKGNAVFLNTGSPHHVVKVDKVSDVDVFHLGKSIRNSEMYAPKGVNVNFVEQVDENHIKVRTYERGVEDETLSCGTGVTASVLGFHYSGFILGNTVKADVLGGTLEVSFEKKQDGYSAIFLKGSAQKVFDGVVTIDPKDIK